MSGGGNDLVCLAINVGCILCLELNIRDPELN